MRSIREMIAITKFTIQRGWTWLNVPSFALVGAGVLKPYFPNHSLWSLCMWAIVVILIVGILDKKLNLLTLEQGYAVKNNKTLINLIKNSQK